MKVSYKDIQRGSDYKGTTVTFEAEYRQEWWDIQRLFLMKGRKAYGEHCYDWRADEQERTLELDCYDGANAACMERVITGSVDVYAAIGT